MSSAPTFNFVTGETLLVNKPLQWTSFDVVNKLRYALKKSLGLKKIKVGHAGTLDPLATGLLIVCTGRKTKSINEYMGMEKTYEGTFELGATTPSFDLETPVDQTFAIDDITPEKVQGLKSQFMGELQQSPPVFSAKRVDGEKAYEKVRRGEEVMLKANSVVIHDLEFTAIDLPKVDFKVRCSKGTYIRALARDVGTALENGAHLTRLTRTAIGDFQLADAKSVDDWVKIIETSDPASK